jgi:hypothetical protein
MTLFLIHCFIPGIFQTWALIAKNYIYTKKMSTANIENVDPALEAKERPGNM